MTDLARTTGISPPPSLDTPRFKFEEKVGENYRQDWRAPKSVVEPLHAFANEQGGIALEPYSGPDSIVQARVSWSAHDRLDPLKRDWSAYSDGVVFCNPPYGRAIASWVTKCRTTSYGGQDVIALVPARTDTRWFAEIFASADAILFWKGRLSFLGAPAPAKFPSAVIYWGRHRNAFQDVFAQLGALVHPLAIGHGARFDDVGCLCRDCVERWQEERENHGPHVLCVPAASLDAFSPPSDGEQS